MTSESGHQTLQQVVTMQDSPSVSPLPHYNSERTLKACVDKELRHLDLCRRHLVLGGWGLAGTSESLHLEPMLEGTHVPEDNGNEKLADRL